MVNDLGHAAGNGSQSVLAGLEQLDHIRDGPRIAQVDRIPILDLGAGDVQLAIPAGIAHCLLLESQTTWGVTRPAMPEPLHKVGATVPLCVLMRVGYERGRV
jgi:hypothetical protein